MKEALMTQTDILQTTLNNSRKYTLDVANAMPEKNYDFKPAGAGWNFGELLHHIAYGIEWWTENFIKGNETGWNPPPQKKGKKHVTDYLQQSYDLLKASISEGYGEQAIKGFYATIDHITHHRGQAVLYLRLNNIEPPEYIY